MLLFSFLLMGMCSPIYSQDATPVETDTVVPVDAMDFLKDLFNVKEKPTTKPPKSVAILPSIGYNPSLGVVFGAKISAIRQTGPVETTNLSAIGLEGVITSRGIITVQARSNIFTKDNKWNLQGNWQLSKYIINDYGVGTGNKDYRTNSDSLFIIKFSFLRFTEKVYYKTGENFYVGAGVSFDIRHHINDTKLAELNSTPHYRYSVRNGFDTLKYSANGFLLGIQYNTKEHPLRSYGGIYFDAHIRFNQTWLGSSQNATQVNYDFRKYWSLSQKNPEHVFAIWHWASYLFNGALPYLEMPATAYDTYNRSGRAFTIGRFKGPSYACFEAEYRFPIMRNKLISGVAFFNAQTASDDIAKEVFDYWETGGGVGLRILFQKHSRSTMCIDYARGKYSSSAFFFGLNEAF